jgi:hypothetical protein
MICLSNVIYFCSFLEELFSLPINSFAVILREKKRKKKSCIEEVGIIFPVFENRYSLGLENLGINYKDFCFVLFLCNLILFTKNK